MSVLCIKKAFLCVKKVMANEAMTSIYYNLQTRYSVGGMQYYSIGEIPPY